MKLRSQICAAAVFGAMMLMNGLDAQVEQTAAQRIQELERKVQSLEESADAIAPPSAIGAQQFSLGGYGEVHFNMVEGDGADKSDPHRVVFYVGYDFADWVKFNSEIEIEHGFVQGGNGELYVEQLHVDFLRGERFNVRVGRLLIPVGIVNLRHEPTTFNGVERPALDTVVIPTTFFADGAGIFGNLSEQVKYEAYVTNSLNAAGFSANQGIRGGRLKEQPGLKQLAVSGRLDYSPLRNLRVGGSFFGGGADNGNKGVSPKLDVSVKLYALDAQYHAGKVDFRGEFARVDIDGAENLTAKSVGSAIQGWFLESGWHCWPEAWKQGRLADADAVVFARLEQYDTQYDVPASVTKDPTNNRKDLTLGINFYPVSSLVLKADYQLLKSAGTDPANQWNLGMGWMF